jgi:thiol-disulfide isomerase/thioredoxin
MTRLQCVISGVLGGALVGFAPAFSPAGEDAASAAKRQARVTLLETDWAGVQTLVASHVGKVVVVDIWTTTCPACVAELPKFVALQNRFGPEQVACISVNCDYDGVPDKPPAFYRPRVLEMLQKNEAVFPNAMLTTSLIKFLDEAALASTPAVYVYNAKGKLERRFDNDDAVREEDEFHMADVERLVESLLK